MPATLKRLTTKTELIFLMSFFDTFEFQPGDVSSPTVSTTKPQFKPHAKFTAEDDEVLKHLVEEFGENNWLFIAERMPGRNPRQVKERWMYYLSPKLNHSPWTKEEDDLLLQKQQEIGSKWVRISQFFHNRTDAMVKNRFQVLKRREQKEKDLQTRREQYLSRSSGQLESPAAVPVEHAVSEVEVFEAPSFDIFDAGDSFSLLGLDFELVF